MQQELNQLRQQIYVLKVLLVAVFVCMVIGWVIVSVVLGRSASIIAQTAEFETITTRKLVVQTHGGQPWLVAEESLAEPDMPELGGNQFLRIGEGASNYNCWLDGRGGIQMWMEDGSGRERISFVVRGGPDQVASMVLRHPEPGEDVPFSALSCNASCRDRMERRDRVVD